jgi:hypothetical protein
MADESQINATNPTLPVMAGTFDAFVGPHLPVLLRVAGSLCRNMRARHRVRADLARHHDYRRLKSALAESSAPMPAEPLPRLQALAADLAAGDTSPT